MALVDHNGEAEFPVSKDKVFDAMCVAIPTIKGLSIESADKFFGRILVKGGVSLASWGESVPIQLTALDENRTKVSITSTPKTGAMFGGANDMGKNRKNVEQIFSVTSQVLQNQIAGNYQQPQQATQASYQQPYNQPRPPANKKMGIGKKILIGIGILFIIALIGSQMDEKKGNNSSNASTSTETSSAVAEQTTNKGVGVGQSLQTEYFKVAVNKVSVKDRVNTGNEFADLKQEPGNKYLILNVTFKNTDNESRMIMDGSVFINYNGKDYEFDKSETVMLEGWGTMLEQINPLTSKTTNLVYKIPDEMTGIAYWNPGRSDHDQVINLGSIK